MALIQEPPLHATIPGSAEERVPEPITSASRLRADCLRAHLGDLDNWQIKNEGTLLQYVDDLLLRAPTKEKCVQLIICLLNYLGTARYRVSQKKA